MKKYRGFYLDEPGNGRAGLVLRNINNPLDVLDENNVEVELVASCGGANTFVKGLIQSGITDFACA